MLRVLREQVRFETVNVGPNGNWVYEGRPFTGVAYTLSPGGEVDSEQEFRDGLQWGPVWEHFRSGEPYYEASFFRDVLHGLKREWHPNGRLAEEGEYEYGYALWERKWSPTGELIAEYRLRESDAAFQGLQQLRQVFAGQG